MKSPKPPQRITNFLERICPPYLFEGIVGDLEEQFYSDLETDGESKAKRRYWWGALRFIRPEIIFRNKFRITHNVMLGNYIKIAGRNMARRKLFSFINAFGLSIGISFCVLIYAFIQDENSFDLFHANKDRIYRVEQKSYDFWGNVEDGDYYYSAYVQVGFGPAIKEEFSQVEYATRYTSGQSILTYGDNVSRENLHFIDQDFFQMFSFPVIKGDANQLLTDKYQVVITPEIATKLFGDEDPLGKVLKIDVNGGQEFTVSGVIAAPPSNSSIQYQILISQENRSNYEKQMTRWSSSSTPTFIQLHAGTSPFQLDAALEAFKDKYMSENMKRNREGYNLSDDIETFSYQYSKLADIHLNTQVSWYGRSDPQYSVILGGIAVLIMLVAAINYISLSLTTSTSRKIEVGVRKAIGARRSQLVQQFVLESVILSLLSVLIGLALTYLFLPYFNEFTKKEIVLDLNTMLELGGIGLLISIIIGLLAGCYPAFFLSAFKPTQVLKGGFTAKLRAGFTKPLVVLQFALSAFLIISSVVMYQQMQYITNKDLGYDQEHILVVSTQYGRNEKSDQVVQRMRTRLQQETFAIGVAGVNNSFNEGISMYGYEVEGENKSAFVYTVDPQYIDLLEIEMKEGRNFNQAIISDSNAVIVNESLVADMGWEDPLLEHLNWQEDSTSLGARVIGVAKDYHFLSLEYGIEPMFLSTNAKSGGHLTTMLIKLNKGDLSKAVHKLRSIWMEIAPDKPFDYSFLDEDVARQYESYQRWVSIMGLSTLFAILISCLGLFGLAGVNAINRTKEIGIRKVFGAQIASIFVLLNKQYVVLAFIAFVLATPISWYAMEQWLEGFEYGVDLSWQLFAISMLAGLVIALVTVSYHALRAGQLNPAETLKYE